MITHRPNGETVVLRRVGSEELERLAETTVNDILAVKPYSWIHEAELPPPISDMSACLPFFFKNAWSEVQVSTPLGIQP